MNILDSLRLALNPWGAAEKAAAKALVSLPIVPLWTSYSFITPTWGNLLTEAYKKNSAFLACISVYTRRFPEPPLRLYKDEEELDTHPTRILIARPNPLMGEAELWQYTIAYAAIGGNAYWHKVRNNEQQVFQLWPHHVGNIMPVPGGDNWISHYEYDAGDGRKQDIPAEDIVHFKWSLPDPQQPWLAVPPIIAAAREVDTDNEATRYLYNLLKNDAVVRTAFVLPADNPTLDAAQFDRLKGQIESGYTGDKRGRPALLEGGMDVKRLSLDLEEMAFEALHRIPETRIAAAMGVPAMLVGLQAGLERSTYSNMEEAVSDFTRGTLSPLWRSFASEITHDDDLNPGRERGESVAFDLAHVGSLQEDENERWERYGKALDRGAITINEYRAFLGMEDLGAAGDIVLWKATSLPVRLNGTGDPEILIERPAAAITDSGATTGEGRE